MYTASCCRYLASKGYPIVLTTPGNNKEEILRVVEEIGSNFEQIVLLGYPPFLKDVIDTGISRGIDWRQYQIKLVMAGEVFSEEWRDLVGERIGSQNPYYDSASLYGTADAGVLGNETPLSICIRRHLAANPVGSKNFIWRITFTHPRTIRPPSPDSLKSETEYYFFLETTVFLWYVTTSRIMAG